MASSGESETSTLAKGAEELMQSPRVAGCVSGSTIAAWFGDVFNMVEWGDVAACIGAVLSLVLIFGQVRKILITDPLDRKRIKLQIELMEAEKVAGKDR